MNPCPFKFDIGDAVTVLSVNVLLLEVGWGMQWYVRRQLNDAIAAGWPISFTESSGWSVRTFRVTGPASDLQILKAAITGGRR